MHKFKYNIRKRNNGLIGHFTLNSFGGYKKWKENTLKLNCEYISTLFRHKGQFDTIKL